MTCKNNCPMCKCNSPKGVVVNAHEVDPESGSTNRVQLHMPKATWDKIAEVANGTKAEA